MKNYILLLAVLLISASPLSAQHHKDTAHTKQNKKIMNTVTEKKFEIPSSLKKEHSELHANLEKFTQLKGKTGVAAKELARLLHPHFIKEEEYALPLLGLLSDLAKGKIPDDSKQAIEMAAKLKKEFQQMLKEHQQIVTALEKLNQAAMDEYNTEVMLFSENLKLHARTEEEVLYPAAILIGEYLKLKT